MPKPTVLVVDDAAFMRMLLKKILVEHGFYVVGEADNGADAVERYEALKPFLVTMDITMPGMNGLEAVRQIIAKDPRAHIIMVSAMGQQAMVVDAVRAGAKDFIVKPFDPERVAAALERVMAC